MFLCMLFCHVNKDYSSQFNLFAQNATRQIKYMTSRTTIFIYFLIPYLFLLTYLTRADSIKIAVQPYLKLIS